MFTDSHCHINYPQYLDKLPALLADMEAAQVSRALCISTTMESYPSVRDLAHDHAHIWATVGVHPDNEGIHEPSAAELSAEAEHAKVIAIGETGLDYYQMDSRKGGRSITDMEWQRQRFRTHIEAAQTSQLPLVIHCREAADHTLGILRESGDTPSGVFHCFTDTKAVAKQALDLGFLISFSGIITFKNASALREVVEYVPLDRLLIETDSPYLAPVPHRGKDNSPAYVPLVAQQVAQCKNTTVQAIAQATNHNFDQLFAKVLTA